VVLLLLSIASELAQSSQLLAAIFVQLTQALRGVTA
jgi:hypothetical protein